MQAPSHIPDRKVVQTEDFMDFNPAHITTYMLILSQTSETSYSADVREMLLLAMIHDFMAYASQQNRVSIDFGILLSEARSMMVHSIRVYKGTAT